MTLLLIGLVLTFVLATIWPHVLSVAVHHTVLEMTLKVAFISPLKVTKAAHIIIIPHSRVLTTIAPVEDTFALFFSSLVGAMIVASIAPYLDAFSVLVTLDTSLIRRCSLFKVCLDVISNVLSEYAQMSLTILLPKALVSLK